jgi:hypothetical protein
MSTATAWQSSDAALVAELGALETRLHSTWAQMLAVVAEIDFRDMAGGLGYRTTADLVRAVARVPQGEARARIAAATDVLPSRGLNGAPVEPKLPVTAAAVAEHAIGAADVKVVRSILARIPPHLGAQIRTEAEAELAHHARTLDAGQLETLGKRILAYLDQDGARPKNTCDTRRHLCFRDRNGGYELAGWLDREAAEIVRAALSPLAAPRPATDTEIDLRTASQRDADALVELAHRALEAGDLPTEGGERPQVVVTVSLAVLRGRIGSASLALGGPINADVARRIACDAQVIPMVLGARGEPLDVGRASHTIPTAIRRAVIVRTWHEAASSGALLLANLRGPYTADRDPDAHPRQTRSRARRHLLPRLCRSAPAGRGCWPPRPPTAALPRATGGALPYACPPAEATARFRPMLW